MLCSGNQFTIFYNGSNFRYELGVIDVFSWIQEWRVLFLDSNDSFCLATFLFIFKIQAFIHTPSDPTQKLLFFYSWPLVSSWDEARESRNSICFHPQDIIFYTSSSSIRISWLEESKAFMRSRNITQTCVWCWFPSKSIMQLIK